MLGPRTGSRRDGHGSSTGRPVTALTRYLAPGLFCQLVGTSHRGHFARSCDADDNAPRFGSRGRPLLLSSLCVRDCQSDNCSQAARLSFRGDTPYLLCDEQWRRELAYRQEPVEHAAAMPNGVLGFSALPKSCVLIGCTQQSTKFGGQFPRPFRLRRRS